MNKNFPFDVLIDNIEKLYQSLELQLAQSGHSCKACGKCCDFESFGHRLYLTTPELLYFKLKLDGQNIPPREMTAGVCPWRENGKCAVYPWRFAGCRIFNCTGDPDLQSRLSEEIIAQTKQLCERLSLPYQYRDLKTALNTESTEDTQ